MNLVRNGSWLRNVSGRDFFYIFIWLLVWLKLFDLVAVKVVSKWQQFFTYYDGYRLPASIAAFVPFTLATLRDDSTYTIVFTGDSTSGALLYHHSQAIPAYLNASLNANGKSVHTYNLAFSGAHLSEQYLLMKEILAEADLVVFPIHYSFFSGRGPENSFISHPELRDFLGKAEKDDLSLVGLAPVSVPDRLLGNLLGKVWYTYRVHRLLPFITLGKPIRFWLRDQIDTRIHLIKPADAPKQITIDSMVPFRDQSPDTQQEIIRQNELLWQRITPIDKTNVNLQYLAKIGALSQKSGKPILAYFVPLDLATLQRKQNFNTEAYAQIIQVAKQTLAEWHIPFIDFNEGNPAQLVTSDFYNPDHLLPAGNQKVGHYLAERILDDF